MPFTYRVKPSPQFLNPCAGELVPVRAIVKRFGFPSELPFPPQLTPIFGVAVRGLRLGRFLAIRLSCLFALGAKQESSLCKVTEFL
jgi:hypothetical protein